KITEETGKFIDKYAFDNKPQSVCNGIPKTNCDELFSTSYSINQYFEKYDMYEHIFPAFESREIKRPKNISVADLYREELEVIRPEFICSGESGNEGYISYTDCDRLWRKIKTMGERYYHKKT